jgi:hemerythrin superfamily protein
VARVVASGASYHPVASRAESRLPTRLEALVLLSDVTKSLSVAILTTVSNEGRNMATRPQGRGTAEPPQDAIAALTADHRKVKALFKEFARSKESGGRKDPARKSELVSQICNELKIHAEIEEEIFYPAVRKAIEDSDLMDEALVEHAGAKDLIAQLEEMDVDDELYDARVTVLGEQIDHHVKEEESEMFPKAKKAKVDTERLGIQMESRRAELKREFGILDPDESDEHETEEDTTSKKRRA